MNKSDLQELKETVALATRTLHHQGLATYLGHVSARIPGTDRIIIKPTPHISMDRVTADILMTIDLEGNVIEAPEGAIIPAEWPLHTEAYKARPDVGGVIHTHQKWCTVFGIAGQTILPVQHPVSASVVVPPHPAYDESRGLITDITQGRVVAQTLGDAVGCHLRTHGMVFVGVNAPAAVNAAVNAEHQAEMNWLAMQVGVRESIPLRNMRDIVDSRFLSREDERRDGVARDAWSNDIWADQHREIYRYRVVQL